MKATTTIIINLKTSAMRKFIVLLFAIAFSLTLWGQNRNFWKPVTESSLDKNVFLERKRPSDFRLFQLEAVALKADLGNVPSEKGVSAERSSFILSIPDPDGNILDYKVVEAPVMDPVLAAKYPGIRSFAGKAVNKINGSIRFDLTPLGFHAVVNIPDRPTFYIDPVDLANNTYIVVSRTAIGPLPKFDCFTEDENGNISYRGNGIAAKNADDATLRIYRLAMTSSGEYSQRWLDGTEPDNATRIGKVLAAMNTNLIRVNAIMERDFGVRLVLIANNDDIIYLDASTDPFTSTNSDDLNDMTEGVMNSEIGAANYDIGHLVHEVGDYGKAGCIGCVCSVDDTKGRGFTSRSNWMSGNGFEEYILVHEMGHQFDANHTFTHDDDNDVAQIEPGSGSTLMSYAGITGANTDIQPLMDDYFHAISIQQATDYIKSQTCNTGGATGNNTPTADAGANYVIPKSTPFKLTGSGTDGDGEDPLTFVWEQMDNLTSALDFPWLPATTHTYGPEFRSVLPSSSTSRTFPALPSILDGTNTNKWEKLPSVARDLNFRFTVRDNHGGGGNNNSDDMVVTIDDETGPFTVTSPNSNVSWCPGTHTVTWDANGSEKLAENVNILLSTDGGLSFPVTLAANTPNDGSQSVTISCTYSNTARIKVEAVGNIFFDISNTNFSIGDNTAPTFTKPADITIYKDANCNYDASTGITGDVTDEEDDCDNSLDATYNDVESPGSCVGEVVITRTWTLTDDCGNTTQKVQTITATDNTAPTFTEPDDIIIYKDENCNYDASTSITGDVTDEADNCDNTLNATYSDVVVPGSCMGEEIITRTWSLTDDCGNLTTHDQVITAKDTTRPVFSNVYADPAVLWPPNHKMIDVTVNYTVTDNCSDAAHITSTLAVTSNEPINGTGDGDTAPDWEIIDNQHVRLRAERAGNGTGRIYTITITSTDDCGNTATTTTTVTVPHDGLYSRPGSELVVESLTFEARVTPNPSAGSFVLYVNSSDTKEGIVVSVVDMLGRAIETRNMNSGSALKIGADYVPGIYIIRVMQGANRKEIKVVKQ
jgi:hypothetical protein